MRTTEICVILRSSLTHVEFPVDHDIEDILEEMQLTVNGFISMFTNLKHLYVWHHTVWSDLQEIGFPFLFTNHTGLETVILQGKYAQRHIINPDRLELVLEDTSSYDSLKRLEMVLSHMDIGHLEYIMKRFPKMKKIRIQMLDRGTVGAVTTSVEKVESIIE